MRNTTQSITNGPYKLSGPFTDGTVTTMVPNANYHSSFLHKPVLDKVIFKVATNTTAETQGYKVGQYDAAFDFNVPNLQSFNGIPSNEIINTSAVSTEYVDFMQRDAAPNAQNAPDHHSIFTNKNVRKAFMEGFNKCAAIQALFGLDCKDPTVFTDQFTSPPDNNYDSTAPAVKFDLTDANDLLDAAGYKVDNNGIRTYPGSTKEVSIVIAARNNRAVRESMVTLMKDQYSANLHVNTSILLSKKMYADFGSGGIMTTGACDICEAGYIGYGDIVQNLPIFDPAQIPSAANPAGPNWTGTSDPTLSQMFLKTNTQFNDADRLTTSRQIYRYLLDHAITWGLYATPNIALIKSTLGNYKQHPTQQGFNWNITDYYTTGKR